MDMPGYNNVVAQSLAAEDVGGSEKCLAAIKEGHASIKQQLQSAVGRAVLTKQFNLCIPNALEDEKNREQFAGDGTLLSINSLFIDCIHIEIYLVNAQEWSTSRSSPTTLPAPRPTAISLPFANS